LLYETSLPKSSKRVYIEPVAKMLKTPFDRLRVNGI